MRFSVGMMSVLLGLGSFTLTPAQQSTPESRPSSWNWLAPKKPEQPAKPSAGNSAPAPTTTTTPYVLRQTTCNIPFALDGSKNRPIELQLFVSQDRGTNWKLYGKATPADRHFTFRASGDGEYWFALRSVESPGAAADSKSFAPGLKVIFDTREPEFRFEASLNESGEVRATWVVRDPTVLPESLKIEFQTEAQGPWQPVTIPSGAVQRDGSLMGEGTWRAEGLASGVLLRAEVADRAGNKTVVSRRLNGRGEAGQVADSFHKRGRPDGTIPVSQGAQPWPANNELAERSRPPLATAANDLPPPKPSASPAPLAANHKAGRSAFIPAKQPAPDFQGPIPPALPEVAGESGGQPADPEEITPVYRSSEPLPAAASPAPAKSPADPVIGSAGSHAAPAGEQPKLPNGERPRMTGSRTFSLDYEIDSLGPSGIEKVELWGTADGGRTWQVWQTDRDQQSPMDLSVDRDGIFGFRVVVTGSNQLGGAPPQPGDPADLWVGVDTSQPVVRLTSALYGDGAHAGQLDIRWQAVDVGFADRPITLLFSEFPQGPWSTIAAGLANSGQYFWDVDPRVPRHIYLRVEGRDEAGNVGEHQISEPLSTAGLVPQGRIRGLRTAPPGPATEDRSAARGPFSR